MAVKNISGFTTTPVTVPAYSVATLDFDDSKPNYFRVSNSGGGTIYGSTTRMPTANSFDFSVPGNSNKMFAEPFNRNHLYLFNGSGSPVNVVVLSFAADFDPLTLAFGDISVDMGNVSMGAITVQAFNSALPTGNNKIGKVDVSSLPALPAGGNNIGSINVDKLPALPAGTNNIGSVTVAEMAEILAAVKQTAKASKVLSRMGQDTATTSGVTYSAGDNYRISEVDFVSNDGETDISMTVTEIDGTANSMTIKAGEVMAFRCNAASISLSGASVPFRLAYGLEAV